MNRVYVFDGSFQGLLTVLQRLRESGEEPDDIRPDGEALQVSLLAEMVRVETDAQRAERVSSDICELISPGALRRAFRAFLSEGEGVEYHIFRYLRLGWDVGSDVDACLGDEHVHAVQALARRTGREAHRMLGLLRFRELEGGLFYAPMEVQCDVLCLVAGHFTARMGDVDWMVHDPVREQAALYSHGMLEFIFLPGFDPRLSEEEKACQGMWKDYFKTIAVSSRRNSRLQKGFMPRRYWKLLVEEPGRT